MQTNVKAQVRNIMKLYPETRENTTKLFVVLCKKHYSEHLSKSFFGKGAMLNLNKLEKLPNMINVNSYRNEFYRKYYLNI